MNQVLHVYLHQCLVGNLVQDDHGSVTFQYVESWLSNLKHVSISQSLPLRPEPFSEKECSGFFGGILPEQKQREILARNLGISARNDFSMLREIGGECAGAITFLSQSEKLKDDDQVELNYRELTEAELADVLRRLPGKPLLAGEEGIRLSLAGAQSKIAVRVLHGRVFIPLGAGPSTHIIKPAIPEFPGIVTNEALCMALAQSIGIPAATVHVRNAEEIQYLLVERYDRLYEQKPAGRIRRLHQEDFCQALGVNSDQKYQKEGGPSFKQSFDLVRAVSAAPVLDLQSLLDAAIFNFFIGNNDAHGKNFSLLYFDRDGQRETRLAPLYDLICTAIYPELSKKMAMKIGGEYEFSDICPRHFEHLAEEARLSKRFVNQRVIHVANRILAEMQATNSKHDDSFELCTFFRERCQTTLRKFG